MTAYVRTKRELAKAIRTKETDIVICDRDLAVKVIKFKGVKIQETQQAPSAKMMLGAVGVTETVYIVAIITIGIVCLYALYKDYDIEAEVLMPSDKMDKNVTVRMRRNK